MTNKQARLKLQILYGCRCLLTNIQTDKLTYHHLTKKEHGGKATVENGANLIREIHQWLHQLENSDIELYHLVNECLDLFKRVMSLGYTELIEQYETEVMPEARKKLRR
mgnify:CR=1 FL=1